MTPDGTLPSYRLLGTLEVRTPGRAYAPGPSASPLLAALLVRAPEAVPSTWLRAELWPNTHADEALRQRIRSLRRMLGAEEIQRTGAGYAMPDAAKRTDLHAFRELGVRAEQARVADDLERARELLLEALHWWTDEPPLAGLEDYPFARQFAAECVAQREATVIHLLEVLTDLRRYDELADLLRREEPVNSRIAGWRAARPAPRRAGEPVRIVGREAVVDRLCALTAEAWADGGPETRVIRVSGPAGVGISTVLDQVAEQLADRGAQVCRIDMRGEVDEPESVTHAQNALLTALGTGPETMPSDRAGKEQLTSDLLMPLTRSDRLVVILDHVSSAEQVAALTRRDPLWTVIVASRPELPELRPGLAVPVEVPPLTEASAVELLRDGLGHQAVVEDPGATARLVELCERLPYFLGLAAATITRTGETVRHCAATIDQRRRQRPSLAGWGVFAYSHRDLPAAQQELLALIGRTAAVSITSERAAALLATTPAAAEDVLAGLARARLLVAGDGRYLFRPLVLAYAAHLPCDRWPAARQRLLDAMLAEVRRVAGPVGPAEPGARPDVQVFAWDWYRAEGPNLRGAVADAFEAGADEICWRLVDAARPVLYLTGATDDWGHLVTVAAGAAERSGDPIAKARVLMARAERERYLGHWEAAHHGYHEAVELSADDEPTLAIALDGRADLATGMYTRDDDPDWLDQARTDARESHRLFTGQGNVQGAASALSSLAEALAIAGDNEAAELIAVETLELYRSIPDPVNEAVALRILGSIQLRLDRLAEADALLGAAVEVNDRQHTRLEGARALARLGEVQLRRHRYEEAGASLRRAREVLRKRPDLRWRAVTLMLSGRLALATGDHAGAVRWLTEAAALFRRVGETGAADHCEALLQDL